MPCGNPHGSSPRSRSGNLLGWRPA